MEQSSIDTELISAAIDRGFMLLEETQLPSGEFVTLIGSESSLDGGIYDGSPFLTAHVLHSLFSVRHQKREPLVRKALGFLEREMEAGGLWRYYSSGNWKHCRIPPDLDDTACVSHVLKLYGRRQIRNEWIFRACRNESGIFHTWVASRGMDWANLRLMATLAWGDWQAKRRVKERPEEFRGVERFTLETDAVPMADCDPVVNANVLLYLGEQSVTAAVCDYLHEVIQSGPPTPFSQYYHHPVFLYYAIARAYMAGCHSLLKLGEDISSRVLEESDSGSHSRGSLIVAMKTSVLMTFSNERDSINQGIFALLDQQQDDGGWGAESFYSGPTEFWGAKGLSTAVAIEALSRYLKTGE